MSTFHDPHRPVRETTRPVRALDLVALTDGRRRVLSSLCRPPLQGDAYALPASNQAIADELFLSVGAVKEHLRGLFHKLDVEDLLQNQKRLRLVERAVRSALVSQHKPG